MEIRRQEDAPVMVMFIERTSKILNFNKNEACDDSTIDVYNNCYISYDNSNMCVIFI